jgi:hypothetical protein
MRGSGAHQAHQLGGGGGIILLDCISVVTRPQSRWDRPNRVMKNRLFRLEARSIRRSLLPYDPDPARLRP